MQGRVRTLRGRFVTFEWLCASDDRPVVAKSGCKERLQGAVARSRTLAMAGSRNADCYHAGSWQRMVLEELRGVF